MNVVKCIVPGCLEEFQTEERVSESATFICKNHPRSEQKKANKQVFDPVADMQDAAVNFQDGQFDPQFGSRPSIPLIDDLNAPRGIVDNAKWRVEPNIAGRS